MRLVATRVLQGYETQRLVADPHRCCQIRSKGRDSRCARRAVGRRPLVQLPSIEHVVLVGHKAQIALAQRHHHAVAETRSGRGDRGRDKLPVSLRLSQGFVAPDHDQGLLGLEGTYEDVEQHLGNPARIHRVVELTRQHRQLTHEIDDERLLALHPIDLGE